MSVVETLNFEIILGWKIKTPQGLQVQRGSLSNQSHVSSQCAVRKITTATRRSSFQQSAPLLWFVYLSSNVIMFSERVRAQMWIDEGIDVSVFSGLFGPFPILYTVYTVYSVFLLQSFIFVSVFHMTIQCKYFRVKTVSVYITNAICK